MSLTVEITLEITCRFPRVSGDEPVRAAGCRAGGVFSPRERG